MGGPELEVWPAPVEGEAPRRKDATQHQETNMKSDEWFRARAKELYCREGEIEVDTNARISFGNDEGAYVEAWVWVPLEERESHSQD
jgi:hypothetical protein